MIYYQRPLITQFDSGLDQCYIDRLLNCDDYVRSRGYRHSDNASELVKERTSLSLFDYQDDFREIRSKMLESIYRETGRYHPIEHAELLQLTRYSQGQQYLPHYDNFNLAGLDPVYTVDRCATALLYLNDGFTGGNTVFPQLNITVIPRQGDILYFEFDPEVYDLTLHAGEPVERGEKRIASLWIRTAPWPVQDSAADPQSL